MKDLSDWDWADPGSLADRIDSFNETLAQCQKLEPVPVSSLAAAQLRELGITGIEFAAWKTAHPEGLGSDIVPLRAGESSTSPGQLFIVDDERHFIQLDIGEALPLANASVEWVYAEHLIEHVPQPVAIRWLTEVRRILAPGGVVRVTTPDLRRYAEAYLNGGSMFATQRHWVRAGGLGPPMPERAAFMVNQIFYLYGHRWIYDLAELQYVFGEAGFAAESVELRAYREGARDDVAQLDRVFRKHETIYVEATA